jgi:hypothetical protein
VLVVLPSRSAFFIYRKLGASTGPTPGSGTAALTRDTLGRAMVDGSTSLRSLNRWLLAR